MSEDFQLRCYLSTGDIDAVMALYSMRETRDSQPERYAKYTHPAPKVPWKSRHLQFLAKPEPTQGQVEERRREHIRAIRAGRASWWRKP